MDCFFQMEKREFLLDISGFRRSSSRNPSKNLGSSLHVSVHLQVNNSPMGQHDATNNCLVYLFGVSNLWTFEKLMENYGCHVFALDPGMPEENNNQHYLE